MLSYHPLKDLLLVLINEIYYDDLENTSSLCRVCANLVFRYINDITEEEEKLLIDNMIVLRPPINNKCLIFRCGNQPTFYCGDCIENYCDEHKDLHLDYNCTIFEGDELWKQCFYWKLYCDKCNGSEKEYWCEECQRLVCYYHFIENDNHRLNIDIISPVEYIDNLYDEAINIAPDDSILKMIKENMGIRPDYIINQLNLFLDYY